MHKLLALVALLAMVTVVSGASAFHHTGLPATFCAAALAGSPSNDTGNAKEAILAHRPAPTLPLPRAGTPGNGQGDGGEHCATAESRVPGSAVRPCRFATRVRGERRQVSVIGSGSARVAEAEEVGRLLAERGCTVVTGGLGEVMAAAHRGAKSADGGTVAIVPGETTADANPWADHVVVTGIGHARNLAVAASGDVVIAIGGSFGTLAEIAYALLLGRPVVQVGEGPAAEGVIRVATPADAVDRALALREG